jgi:hypothetical protein
VAEEGEAEEGEEDYYTNGGLPSSLELDDGWFIGSSQSGTYLTRSPGSDDKKMSSLTIEVSGGLRESVRTYTVSVTGGGCPVVDGTGGVRAHAWRHEGRDLPGRHRAHARGVYALFRHNTLCLPTSLPAIRLP